MFGLRFAACGAGCAAMLLATSCGDAEQAQEPQPDTVSQTLVDPRIGAGDEALPVIEFAIRDHGSFRVELFPHKAPKTVANLLKLAADHFYEGLTFHRVIPGFMIQAGDPFTRNKDPRDDGMGGPGYSIPDEFSDVAHRRGTLSMANKGEPDTGGSQFFVVVADQPELDGKYAAFGEVIEGMEVVDAIAAVETDIYGRWGPRDRPREDVVIESVRVVTNRAGAP